MKTHELFTILENNKKKALLFEYVEGVFVGANYHITEVKHVTIDAIDCGAKTDAWKETIIQLWESPNEIGKTEYMLANKALDILNKVGEIKPYVCNAETKFEYSNSMFHTAQLFVNDYEIRNNTLILKLAIKKTDCKAKELCGVIEQPATNTSNCAPDSGCC